MFLIFLTFLFLYTSYSANIVALLQSSSNQIKTLDDLLNSKLEMGTEDTPYNRHHFTVSLVLSLVSNLKVLLFYDDNIKITFDLLKISMEIKKIGFYTHKRMDQSKHFRILFMIRHIN